MKNLGNGMDLEKGIIFKSCLSQQEYVRIRLRGSFKKGVFYVFSIGGIALVLCSIFELIQSDRLGEEGIWFFLLCIGIISLLTLLRLPAFFRREYSRRPELNSEIEVRIDENLVQLKFDNKAGKFEWGQISEVVEIDGFLLFYSKLGDFVINMNNVFPRDQDAIFSWLKDWRAIGLRRS